MDVVRGTVISLKECEVIMVFPYIVKYGLLRIVVLLAASVFKCTSLLHSFKLECRYKDSNTMEIIIVFIKASSNYFTLHRSGIATWATLRG